MIQCWWIFFDQFFILCFLVSCSSCWCAPGMKICPGQSQFIAFVFLSASYKINTGLLEFMKWWIWKQICPCIFFMKHISPKEPEFAFWWSVPTCDMGTISETGLCWSLVKILTIFRSRLPDTVLFSYFTFLSNGLWSFNWKQSVEINLKDFTCYRYKGKYSHMHPPPLPSKNACTCTHDRGIQT